MNWYKKSQRVRTEVYPGVEELPAGMNYSDIGHRINKDEKRILWGLDDNWVFRTKELDPEEYSLHDRDVLGDGWMAAGRYAEDRNGSTCTICFPSWRNAEFEKTHFQERVYKLVTKKFPAGTKFYKA